MRHWVLAFRLRTLPLALSCVLVGSAFALMREGFSILIFSLTVSTTVFLQVLSNLANDYGDSENGADHADRKGPSRAVQTGVISKAAMFKAVVICSLLALISGILLLFSSFESVDFTLVIFFLLGIGAIVAAIKYTMGRNPYGYRALGDLFVFLFFGPVGVIGTYYLQAQEVSFLVWVGSLFCGMLSVAVLNMNNMRDVESDEQAGKITLPLLLKKMAPVYHVFLIVIGVISYSALILTLQESLLELFLLLLCVPFILNLRKVLTYKDPSDLDVELKKIALGTFACSMALFLSMMFKS